MKKILNLVAILAVGMAFGAANNTVLRYEMPVNSTYADGKPVQSGESYALVYIPDSADGEFAIAADGSEVNAANGRILAVVSPKHYKNRCVFEFNVTPEIAEECKNGKLVVYLLDTRVFDQQGNVSYAAINPDTGRPTVVNAATAVPDAVVSDVTGSRTQSNVSSASLKTLLKSQVPASVAIEKPVIRNMRIENGEIVLTIEKTSPMIAYDVAKSDKPDAAGVSHAAETAKNGVACGTIELRVPMTQGENSAFFRIERH